ncbi:MAG: helix-turn-helix transcriptional regulator [Lutisporaceae bacterium]
MAQSLGEKVKALRKELKMTQTDLAGSEMTKSMLSQIENNLATPSMKNLQYLASKLGKSVAYFLEASIYQPDLPIEEIHEALKAVNELIDNAKPEEALIKLENILEKYNLDHDSKLYADFLDKYGQCLIDLNRIEDGQEKIKEAVGIYKDKFLFIDAAKAYLTLMKIYWNSFDYYKCMEILEEALEISDNSINKDKTFEIEAMHIKSILYTGMDKVEDSVIAAEKALSISKETNIYYKADELHKNLAHMNSFLGKYENFDFHMNKARQFAIFTDNINVLASIEVGCGMYANQTGRPKEALEYLNKVLVPSTVIAVFVYTEKAKALYMLEEYRQALDTLKLVQYPSYTPFRYDYLHIWSSKVYKGLCLNKLGNTKEAVEDIKQGIEKMQVVGESKTLAFAYKSLSEVYSDMKDFESAFEALKRANEIDEFAKENKLYY